jgi:hypothetical protein
MGKNSALNSILSFINGKKWDTFPHLGKFSPNLYLSNRSFLTHTGFFGFGIHYALKVIMKRFLTILFLGSIFLLITGMSYIKFQQSSYSHQGKNKMEYFANELEQKLYIP